MQTIKELYDYREMIISLVRKDLKGRYKGSVLGFLWTFINPLLQLIVYTVVFQYILKNPTPQYYIHLFVALVPWIFFSSALTTGSKAILGQANMIKKIYFPREVMPIAYSTSSFINMLLSFIIIFVVVFFSGRELSVKAFLYLPFIMITQYILVTGVTFITSSLTVYLRDLEHIMGVLNMALMYLTPVVYGIEYIPEKMRGIYMINPMSSIVVCYRDILYYGKVPQTNLMLLGFGLSVLVFVIGWVTFSVLKKHFAEEL